MKKIYTAMMAVACTIGLAACGNATTQQKELESSMVKEQSTSQMADSSSMANSSSMDKEESMKDSMMSENAAPQFTLMDLEGKTHSLADYKGKKLYVKFWASWCSVCLAGLGDVNQLAGSQEDFVVLSIVTPGVFNEKSKDEFTKWYAGLNYSHLPVLFGEEKALLDQYGVRAYPTAAFIDSEGNLVETAVGHLSNEEIIAKMKEMK